MKATRWRTLVSTFQWETATYVGSLLTTQVWTWHLCLLINTHNINGSDEVLYQHQFKNTPCINRLLLNRQCMNTNIIQTHFNIYLLITLMHGPGLTADGGGVWVTSLLHFILKVAYGVICWYDVESIGNVGALYASRKSLLWVPTTNVPELRADSGVKSPWIWLASAAGI